jgi:hypothetical protein
LLFYTRAFGKSIFTCMGEVSTVGGVGNKEGGTPRAIDRQKAQRKMAGKRSVESNEIKDSDFFNVESSDGFYLLTRFFAKD